MNNKTYHFIGIGGIGMGTLATLLLNKGYKISGSDIRENQMIMDLKELGAEIFIGHDVKNIKNADVAVFSSAIFPDNPEMIGAKKRNIPLLLRAELLALLMSNETSITVAGAHGKTTTTSMISNLFINADLNPTTAIGGIITGTKHHATLGEGKYFIAEVDESDESFLYFSPDYSVITNIDHEHVDQYETWDDILLAYKKFIEKTSVDGCLVVYGDDRKLMNLLSNQDRKVITYGFEESNDVIAKNVTSKGFITQFECFVGGESKGQIALNVPGAHNVLNALACIAIGWLFDIEFTVIQKSLREYKGVQRRFQIKGDINGVLVIDDYGHHPTEIIETIKTAKRMTKDRLITVFQPHRYSRTQRLVDDFVESLSETDELILTDIYAASEKPIEGVSSQVLLDKFKEKNSGSAEYFKLNDINVYLQKIVKPGDVVLTLGAGDIHIVAERLVRHLQGAKYEAQGLKS